MSYLDELNTVQRNAVTHKDGPLLVIAGPGSGKTRVLTYRIAHLIEQGVPPYSILALTFTNKSAKEMKERIVKVVGDLANQVWAGTFHSIFARILRAEASKIGYPSDFTIYDVQDVKSTLSQIVRSQGLDLKVYRPNALYSRISLAKNNLISPQEYKLDTDRLLADKQQKIPYAYKIYDLYQKQLFRAGAMDFDDLLYQIHRLFDENPENVVDKYRNRFKYILVDEFQDTNQLQAAIIKFLAKYEGSPENICVVGDDAQSIYAFRGATINNILDFEKAYPTLSIYKLEQNYRSTHYIVQAANDVITHNRRQLKKKIFTDKGSGEKIKVMRSPTESDEARQVVTSIVEQKNRFHLENDDFAILYRINAQSRAFEEALKFRRIPYKIYGGMSFYDRKEIKDVLGYLRILVNDKDDEALRRIINYPTRGIGATSFEKIQKGANTEGITLWEALHKAHQYGISKSAHKSVRAFIHTIELLKGRAEENNAHEVADYAVRMIGIMSDLKKDDSSDGRARVENVQELLDGIKAFVESDEVLEGMTQTEDKSLTSYLQNVVLLTDIDNDQETQSRVKLMSVHAAKGLEFKSVFIVGMEENIFPSLMAIRTNDWTAIEEERRLFYVAITRAEQLLTLSYATGRYQFGKLVYNNTSRFLEEVPTECLDFSAAKGGGSRQKSTSQGRQSRISAMRPLNKRPISGFNRSKPTTTNTTKIIASPPSKIVAGAKVLHQRFGEGKVISLDGKPGDQIATILFQGVGEKRIMLKYAKLQVVG